MQCFLEELYSVLLVFYYFAEYLFQQSDEVEMKKRILDEQVSEVFAYGYEGFDVFVDLYALAYQQELGCGEGVVPEMLDHVLGWYGWELGDEGQEVLD